MNFCFGALLKSGEDALLFAQTWWEWNQSLESLAVDEVRSTTKAFGVNGQIAT